MRKGNRGKKMNDRNRVVPPSTIGPPPTEEEQRQMQQLTGVWLTILVRGLLMRAPLDIVAHGHKDKLYIRAKLYKKDGELTRDQRGEIKKEDIPEEDCEFEEMFLINTPNLQFNPGSQAFPADFKGEWPPESLIKEHETPKIVKPSQADVAKILKQSKDKAVQ